MKALYNDIHGVLVIKPDDGPNIEVHELSSFVDAWQTLNDNGYDCSGFVRKDLGSGLGEALVATDLEYIGHSIEGSP